MLQTSTKRSTRLTLAGLLACTVASTAAASPLPVSLGNPAPAPAKMERVVYMTHHVYRNHHRGRHAAGAATVQQGSLAPAATPSGPLDIIALPPVEVFGPTTGAGTAAAWIRAGAAFGAVNSCGPGLGQEPYCGPTAYGPSPYYGPGYFHGAPAPGE